MMLISSFIILMLNFYSLFAQEQFVNNPVKSNNTLNIVYYTYLFDLEKNPNKNITVNSDKISVKLNCEIAYYNSYIYSHDFFISTNHLNNNFLLIEKKMYLIETNNEEYFFKFEKGANSDYKYTGYMLKKYNALSLIILYGKKNDNLYFILLNSGKTQFISIGNFDGNFSCKYIEDNLYFCAFSTNNILRLKYFILNFSENKKKDIETEEYPAFIVHDNIILYDTSNNKNKMLCAKKINNSEIECIILVISYTKNEGEISSVSTKFIDIDKNEYKINFSYEHDNCNYTIFNSEYLICCGKTDIIYCERRKMDLQLIDLFNITFPGKIKNLTIESDNNKFLKLIYNNISSEGDKNIYEYHIYPPKCNNTYLKLYQFQTKSLDLDKLFERKTNTNYYISFNNIFQEYGKLYINNELIQNEKVKKILTKNGNTLTFISDNYKTIENFKIKYNISIDETYSSECSLYLTIKPCYHSCKNCTEETPNVDNHFCISCKEEEGYYPYSSSKNYNNCYNETEMNSKQIQYYFDEDQKIFLNCYPECQTCNGTKDNNCLSCKDENQYLYKGKCYSQCPNKMYPFADNFGSKTCKNCHPNCESCHSLGDDDFMNCSTCPLNYIFFKYNNEQNLKNCYYPIDNKTKIFYTPNYQITSCKNFSKYIIENTNECIDELKEGYYVSNNETNILSLCHSSCKSCYGNYTDDDTNCSNCSIGYYKTEDSNTNCILESLIKPNYYKNTSDNIYYKCHENCHNCTTGFNSLNGDMNCILCKDDYYKLNGTNNCYNKTLLNESYYFKEDMFFHCDDNCLTCSEGKNRTSNNCISCDKNKGLYLVEKLNNCEYKNYSGYYLDANNDIEILKKCYHRCKSCYGPNFYNNFTKIENHSCQECEEYFQKLPNDLLPNNCYDNKTIDFWLIFSSEISTKKIEPSTFDFETNKPDIDFEISNKTPTINMELDTIEKKSIFSKPESTDLNIFQTISKLENFNLELNLTTSKLEFTTWKLDFTDNFPNIKCYNTCLNCNESPIYNENEIIVNHNCYKCKDGYYFKIGTENCYNNETIEEGYYLNIVSNCSYGTYEYEQLKDCLKYFPSNYWINQDQNKKIEYTTSSEFKAQVTKNISAFINSANSSEVINGSDFIAVIIPTDNMNPKEQLKKGISAIDLGNCTKVIKEY